MSLFFADLVRETSRGTGTGDLALAGPVAGHRQFADAVPPGARFHYCIAGVTHAGEWETGEGELGSGGSLVRLPLASSAAGAAVDFSPGLKTVALTVGAAWFAARDERSIALADVDGLEAALAEKAAADDLAALETALAGKASTSDLADAVADIAALDAALAGKASAADLADAAADIAALDTALAGKAASADLADAVADISALETALAGKAALAGATFTGAVSAPSLTLGSALALAQGGTGATSAAGARTSLGLGSIATQAASAVAITGGTASGLSSLGVSGDCTLSGVYRVGASQVVGARRTGWSAPTGTASRAAFDTSGTTVLQLAQRLKALIDDLTTHGLIGS
jgi:hypothetical protein